MQNGSRFRTTTLFLSFVLASCNTFSLPAAPTGLSLEMIQTLEKKRFSTKILLQDKVVVITGATKGVGKALCRVFSGHQVAALDFDESALGPKGNPIRTIVARSGLDGPSSPRYPGRSRLYWSTMLVSGTPLTTRKSILLERRLKATTSCCPSII